MRIANYFFKEYLNMPTEKDILKQTVTGHFKINNTILTQAQEQELFSEAEALMNMPTMKLLLNEMDQVACKKIYKDSLSVEDILAGKMMLYYTEVLKTKIEKLAQKKK